MASPFTDYSEKNTDRGMDKTFNGPSRFNSYLVDLLKTWFGNPDNITDDQLKKILFNRDKGTSTLLIDSGYPEDQRFADKSPVCTVHTQKIEFSCPGLEGIAVNQVGAVGGATKTVTQGFSVIITLRIQSYAACLRLTELLAYFFVAFERRIQQDSGISRFRVAEATMDKTKALGDSKDVYSSTIVCVVQGTAPVIVDTVGPVFKQSHLKQ